MPTLPSPTTCVCHAWFQPWLDGGGTRRLFVDAVDSALEHSSCTLHSASVPGPENVPRSRMTASQFHSSANVGPCEPPSSSSRSTPSTRLLYDSLPLDYDDDSIRILDLEHGVWSKKQPLRGSLRVVSLKTSPEYAAISYTWGDYADPPHVIVCNGHEVEITISCYEVLCSIRYQFGASSVWVDSVCIHQTDAREKIYQLPLMGEIYTWASPAYIWLGPGNEATQDAIESLQRRSKARRGHADTALSLRSLANRKGTPPKCEFNQELSGRRH